MTHTVQFACNIPSFNNLTCACKERQHSGVQSEALPEVVGYGQVLRPDDALDHQIFFQAWLGGGKQMYAKLLSVLSVHF